MKKISQIIFVFVFIVLISNVSYSQIKLGPGVGMNININNGSDIKASGGIGILASGQLEIPLTKVLALVTNVQFYDNRSGYFKINSTRYETDQTGEIWGIKDSMDYSTSVAYVSFEPILEIRTSKVFYFLAGVSFGYNVQKSYKVTTTESFPPYYDGTGITLRPTTTEKGNFNDEKYRFGMKFGFGFDIPANIFEISPQLYYDYGFTNVSSNLNWKIQTIQLLVTFKFQLD